MTEMLVTSEIEEAQRAYNRRVMEKRAETGCYDEDGLCDAVEYEKGKVVLFLDFVDDSSIHVLRDGRISISIPDEDAFIVPLDMAMKWYENGGEKWLAAKMKELKKKGVVTC